MTDNEIMANILEVGYKASREDEDFNINEISKDWGEEKNKVEKLAAFMARKGLVKWVASGGEMEITEQGIYEYERIHKDK